MHLSDEVQGDLLGCKHMSAVGRDSSLVGKGLPVSSHFFVSLPGQEKSCL